MTRKIILTRGYPGAGKTTWAREYLKNATHRTVHIERDEMRAILGVKDGKTDGVTELAIRNMSQHILESALKLDADVLVSGTNLILKYVKNYVRWADAHEYDVEIVDFVEPLGVLIARNNARPASEKVNADRLKSMMTKYPVSRWLSVDEIRRDIEKHDKKRSHVSHQPMPFKNDSSLPEAILVDIDGTLAHLNDRDPFHFHLVGRDTLDEQVASTVRMYARAGVTIIVMSGRPETCRAETEEWLARYKVPYSELWMRGSEDYRADWIVKDELVRAHIENNYYVLFCLDDRDQVVNHYRSCGYKVYQVEPGNF